MVWKMRTFPESEDVFRKLEHVWTVSTVWTFLESVEIL